MTNETVAGQGQGQGHEQTSVEVQAHEETSISWGGDTMLKSLESLKDNYLAGKELRAKVARLEATIKAQVTTINELVSEKVALKARVSEAEDTAKAAVTEAEQLRANLDYQKDLLGMLQKDHDDLQAAHKALMEDHEKAKDERDVAVLDREQVQRDYTALNETQTATASELVTARAQWFKQEDDMQRAIRDLTAERNSFEEKFRKCKSMAGQIMALDQVRPEPVEGPQYN